jgi:hypothetical protein
MRVQFGRFGEDLVISDGEEALVLTRAGWEQVDATTAFLKSDWLTPAQLRRTFGDELPSLPARAFAGRDLTLLSAGKRAPRLTRQRA